MRHPLFSIVIVNFNGEKYLEQTIKSIISQNCKDYELIIIDGASTDNSIKIIKKFQKEIAYWLSEPDSGQSNAFNKGFAKAKGQFYFWVNSDDLLLPNSLSKAKLFIDRNKGVYWFSANTIFMNEENVIQKCSFGPKWNSWIFKYSSIDIYGPTSIFSSELFKESGGFNEKLFFTMDTDLWLRFKKRGHKFYKIDEYFWAFRIHEASKTSHAFSGDSNPKFTNEKKHILEINNQKNCRIFNLIKYIQKIVLGYYFKSWRDTKKYKNNPIDCLSKNI